MSGHPCDGNRLRQIAFLRRDSLIQNGLAVAPTDHLSLGACIRNKHRQVYRAHRDDLELFKSAYYDLRIELTLGVGTVGGMSVTYTGKASGFASSTCGHTQFTRFEENSFAFGERYFEKSERTGHPIWERSSKTMFRFGGVVLIVGSCSAPTATEKYR